LNRTEFDDNSAFAGPKLTTALHGALGSVVESLSLRGHSILVVEDEPLIALDLQQSLHKAGAKVLSACTLDRALQLAEHARLSAAVLDYGLSAGNCGPVSERLAQRRIPVVIYSGYPDLRQKFPDAVIILKPAALTDVVDAVSALLRTPFLRRTDRHETDHA
jgi:DNA-binding response OmpR family regulator